MKKSRRSGPAWMKDWSAVAGAVIFVLIVVAAVSAPFVSPSDPTAQSISARFRAPGSDGYLLGSDAFGRDVLSRLLWGARVSLLVGVASTALGMLVGVPLGILGGYLGGRLDEIINSVTDILMSVPDLLMALVIVTLAGPGVEKLVWAIAVPMVPRFVRLARAPTIVVREQTFVEAGAALGAGRFYLMLRHVFPNIIGQVSAITALFVGAAIRSEANLSFLGLGVRPPLPSWGGMIKDGLDVLGTAPWLALLPSLCILITILALNVIGDAVRDAMDKRI